MSIKDIPIRVVGPGSQPAEQDGQSLSYIDMPSDMNQYAPPVMPEPDKLLRLDGARKTIAWLRQALADYTPGAEAQIANLNSLDEDSRDLINQVLGEGEVAIAYSGNVRAKTQESVLAGVWRTLYFDDDDRVAYDLLEVADVPHVAMMPDGRQRPVNAGADETDDAVANALPLLVELRAACDRFAERGETHSINLSLLPMSDAELEFLDERLGRGPVDILSRAYGKCQVISTLSPNAWWVRFYNSMGVLILNTLEVVAVPPVVAAAPEDLADSASRLEEIIAPYWSDVA